MLFDRSQNSHELALHTLRDTAIEVLGHTVAGREDRVLSILVGRFVEHYFNFIFVEDELLCVLAQTALTLGGTGGTRDDFNLRCFRGVDGIETTFNHRRLYGFNLR